MWSETIMDLRVQKACQKNGDSIVILSLRPTNLPTHTS